MKTIFIGQYFISLDSVDSTNNYLAKMLVDKTLPEGALVVATAQTGGKGQRGNSWLSESGKNLTASLLLYPRFTSAGSQFFLNMAVSLAVWDCLLAQGLSATLKWPNDILIDELKVGGLLIESTIKGDYLEHSIVGIGLNVNQTKFPEGLRAISASMVLGKELDLSDMLTELCSHIEKRYLQLKAGKQAQLQEEYEAALLGYHEFRRYRFDGQEIEAQITGVDNYGRLELVAGNTVYTADLKQIEFIY